MCQYRSIALLAIQVYQNTNNERKIAKLQHINIKNINYFKSYYKEDDIEDTFLSLLVFYISCLWKLFSKIMKIVCKILEDLQFIVVNFVENVNRY